MSKAYWSGPGRGTASRFADDPPTGGQAYSDAPAYDYDPPTEDLGVYQDYDDYRPDTRWRWVAALAAVVLLVALVAIAVASRGGDSSTSATPSPSAPDQDAISTTPRTVIATLPPSPSPSAAPTSPAATAELPPETVVTVTTPPAAEVPPPAPVPPPAAAAPASTITYTVTGNRQLFDLVTIIYTDEQGFPRTDVNVALPWSRTVVLNPGVTTKSVTATSLTGQLNCTVADGTGATLATQTNNAAIASCTP